MTVVLLPFPPMMDSLLLQHLTQHLPESNEEGYDPQSLITLFIGYFFPNKRTGRSKQFLQTNKTETRN